MTEVIGFFVLLGGIILAGFLGTLFFQRTRFSDFLLLLLLGLLIGPVFQILPIDSISFFRSLAPFFASLALTILLFEGGLQLNFYRVVHELPRAFFFMSLVFVLSFALVTGVLVLSGWGLGLSLLVGVILSGPCSATVGALLERLRISDESKTLLSLESSFTDVLSVIGVIALTQWLLSTVIEWQGFAQALLGSFAIAALVGIVVGVVWISVLRDFAPARDYAYVLSLAILFLVYALTEFARGNGFFAVVVFGLVFGNAPEVLKGLRLRSFQVTEEVSHFQHEVSLFVRTFFFVYAGIVFPVAAFEWSLAGLAVVLSLALLAGRQVGSRLSLNSHLPQHKESHLISTVFPRGFASAVLAIVAFSNSGIASDGMAQRVILVIFLVIVFTNIITTMGVFQFEKRATLDREKERAESEKRFEENVDSLSS